MFIACVVGISVVVCLRICGIVDLYLKNRKGE